MSILEGFVHIESPLYAAALLGQSAYTEGLPNDPYKDESFLDLLATTEVYGGASPTDLVDTWQANWEDTQEKTVKH